MYLHYVPVWKQAPFIRLLVPFLAGLIIQWYFPLNPVIICLFICIIPISLFGFYFVTTYLQFQKRWITGLLLNILLFFTGALITQYNYTIHNSKWIGHYYHDNDSILATLQAPLSSTAKSYKTTASAKAIIYPDSVWPVTGQIIIYFQKDSSIKLSYGDQILFNKNLLPIKNSGNPAGFNYKRYCVFQGIYYQVYLKPKEFVVLKEKKIHWFSQFLFSTREQILNILHKYIKGDKEKGLAEALLIGYKDDLDKTLVQSYSNTGVVHIIAISGLHLGLIYWILTLLLKPFSKRKKLKWISAICIIAGLWIFSFLTGASASVLRSAVMFSCIVIGENLSRKVSIYNTLSASAFLLLCYNPFWFWDVGFQLSYAAVLSIVIFMQPIYNLLYFKNKLIDFIWKLNAVTIAAQVLTVPVSIYYFHQFPNFFLITNLLAVPLSSIILMGELVLCAIAFVPLVAKVVGLILYWLIRGMNGFVSSMDSFPYSIWQGLQINIVQLLFLYITIIGLSIWLFQKKKTALFTALTALLAFVALRSFSFWQSSQQQKLILYNVPQQQAIDFIDGRNFVFRGDSILQTDEFLRNFHLKPARIQYRITQTDSMDDLINNSNYFIFHNKKILLIDKNFHFTLLPEKVRVDIVIVSKNPRLYINEFLKTIDCGKIVFDSSNPAWKVIKWKQDCKAAGISCYDVANDGAFVMNIR